jgi:RNA polymerase sigma factor (sigma-70 family)
VTLHTGDAEVGGLATDILDLHDALKSLEKLSPRQVRIVECRYFGGLSVEQTAEALSVSPRTVKRDWTLARTWLFRTLDNDRTV